MPSFYLCSIRHFCATSLATRKVVDGELHVYFITNLTRWPKITISRCHQFFFQYFQKYKSTSSLFSRNPFICSTVKDLCLCNCGRIDSWSLLHIAMLQKINHLSLQWLIQKCWRILLQAGRTQNHCSLILSPPQIKKIRKSPLLPSIDVIVLVNVFEKWILTSAKFVSCQRRNASPNNLENLQLLAFGLAEECSIIKPLWVP